MVFETHLSSHCIAKSPYEKYLFRMTVVFITYLVTLVMTENKSDIKYEHSRNYEGMAYFSFGGLMGNQTSGLYIPCLWVIPAFKIQRIHSAWSWVIEGIIL